MVMKVKPLIRILKSGDIETIAAAFARLGWHKPISQYERYLAEQTKGERVVLIGTLDGVFAGYVTILWESPYPIFWQANIPEIVDLNMLPQFRRQGIGTLLLDEAENRISERSPIAGIGVGMTADYGAAQIMYVRRGYIPDGRGIIQNNHPLVYGNKITVGDDLTLYFTKTL